MTPLFIRVHESDNAGIVIAPEGVKAGSVTGAGFVVHEAVPQSHKVALRRLERGEPLVRYGQIIGYANRSIEAGFCIREDALDTPAPPALEDLPISTAVPASLPPLEGFTFQGFKNSDGSVGTRNILGITTTVQCAAPTVDYAVRRIKAEILPRFSNVEDVCAITHGYGCGVAIDAPGAAIPIRTLKHISTHPNLSGLPLVVSLGCEKLQPSRLFSSGLPLLEDRNLIRLQDEYGFAESVAAITRAAERRRPN